MTPPPPRESSTGRLTSKASAGIRSWTPGRHSPRPSQRLEKRQYRSFIRRLEFGEAFRHVLSLPLMTPNGIVELDRPAIVHQAGPQSQPPEGSGPNLVARA